MIRRVFEQQSLPEESSPAISIGQECDAVGD